MAWTHPIDPKLVGDYFGDTEAPRTSPHRGTDYKGGGKTLVGSVSNATVTGIYWTDCLGWVCETRIKYSRYYVSYCHLNCATHGINCKGGHATPMKNLKVGDKVSKYQPVGRIGNTGSCSRGAHLHAVLHTSRQGAVSGKAYDLFKYIERSLNAIQKRQQKEVEVCKCCKRPL